MPDPLPCRRVIPDPLPWGLWLCLHHQVAGEARSPGDALRRWHVEQPKPAALVDDIVRITLRTTVTAHLRAEWPVPRIRLERNMEPVLEIRDRASASILTTARGAELAAIALTLLAADGPPPPPTPVVAVAPVAAAEVMIPVTPRGQLSLF